MKQLNTRIVEMVVDIQILENNVPIDAEWNHFTSFAEAVEALNSDWVFRDLGNEYSILQIQEKRKLTFFGR